MEILHYEMDCGIFGINANRGWPSRLANILCCVRIVPQFWKLWFVTQQGQGLAPRIAKRTDYFRAP
jgi:hypothetical protein